MSSRDVLRSWYGTLFRAELHARAAVIQLWEVDVIAPDHLHRVLDDLERVRVSRSAFGPDSEFDRLDAEAEAQ